MDDRCGHMNALLHMGELEGMHETCPLAGARFDVTTGNHQTDGKLGGMT
jgi:nitrite reductase/ring-hydroxylating ferredoxin subunit